jgi:hypothetical protein
MYTGDDDKDHYNPTAGIVNGNTNVTIDGGLVVHNVYGGGAMGSVGTIAKDAQGKEKITKHESVEDGFGLSWPYAIEFTTGDDDKPNTGKTTVTIKGGRIGTDGVDNGYVYGGARGYADERYTEALFANVRETEVNVSYASTPSASDVSSLVVTAENGDTSISTENDTYITPCITGAVFGGAEDGHVYEDAKITITGGLIGNSVYGGGRGKGTYPGKLKYIEPKKVDGVIQIDGSGNEIHDEYDTDIPSWTSGKVYGNTEITMSDGYVVRNIYGGGNLGSVGKGNYASGSEDYYTTGYGEKISTPLWPVGVEGQEGYNAGNDDFLNSGKTTVTITGGTVGTATGTQEGLPTGNIFGACRGKAAADVGRLSPRYDYAPDFYLGYSNESVVTIGDAAKINDGSYSGPRLWGSVYGGGRDGHVRGSTSVTINKGVIGKEYNANDTDPFLKYRGNVFGAGSGMGTYDKENKKTDPSDDKHGTSSGSVTRHTTVSIKGGTVIYQNVYGGGALANVGPPQIPPTKEPAGKEYSLCNVTIEKCTIGTTAGIAAGYGGNVFGAGYGKGLFDGESTTDYGTTIWTQVLVKDGANILGNVFGGGDNGMVKKDTDVKIGE